MFVRIFFDLNSSYNTSLMTSSLKTLKTGGKERIFTWIGAFCENQERLLDFLGYCPLISNLSAVSRFFYANAMIICSLAAGVFMSLKAFFQLYNNEKPDFSCLLYPLRYSLHGAANIFRAGIEAVPFGGNIALGAYNLLGYRLLY